MVLFLIMFFPPKNGEFFAKNQKSFKNGKIGKYDEAEQKWFSSFWKLSLEKKEGTNLAGRSLVLDLIAWNLASAVLVDPLVLSNFILVVFFTVDLALVMLLVLDC